MIKDHLKIHDSDLNMLDTYLMIYDAILQRCIENGLILDISDLGDPYVSLFSIGGETITPQMRKTVFGGMERFRRY